VNRTNSATQSENGNHAVNDTEIITAKRLSALLEPVVKLAGLFSGGGALLSAIVSIAIVMIYAKSIGRNDLLPLVLDKKLTSLLPWMGMTFLFFVSYCLIIFFVSVPYVLGMQVFKVTPATRPRIATLFALSAIAGSTVFIILIYHFGEVPLPIKAALVFGVMLACMLLSLLDIHVKLALAFLSLDMAPRFNAVWWHRAGVFIFAAFPVAASVFCAVYPLSLLLHTYIGDDTPEAVNNMTWLSIMAVVIAFVPAWAFFTSRTNLVLRLLKTAGIALGAAAAIIIMAPGASSNIVYSAAAAMGVRDNTIAVYRLKKNFVLTDFDSETWGPVTGGNAEPVVSGFALFSLADILLLCPATMAAFELKDWGTDNAQACVLTHSSDVVRRSKNVLAPNKAGAGAQTK